MSGHDMTAHASVCNRPMPAKFFAGSIDADGHEDSLAEQVAEPISVPSASCRAVCRDPNTMSNHLLADNEKPDHTK